MLPRADGCDEAARRDHVAVARTQHLAAVLGDEIELQRRAEREKGQTFENHQE